jgi:hypothetical protein
MKPIFIGLFLILAVGAAPSTAGAQSAPASPLSVSPVTPEPPSKESPEAATIRSKLEALGYSDITDVERDPTGVWRAHAHRGGDAVVVAIDKGGRVHLVH